MTKIIHLLILICSTLKIKFQSLLSCSYLSVKHEIVFAFVLDNLASESESDSEEKYKEEFIGGYDDKTEDNFNGR